MRSVLAGDKSCLILNSQFITSSGTIKCSLLNLTFLFTRNEKIAAALTNWSDHTAACKMPVPQLTDKEMIRSKEENPEGSQNMKTCAHRMPGGPGYCRKCPECPFMGEMPELEKIDI